MKKSDEEIEAEIMRLEKLIENQKPLIGKAGNRAWSEHFVRLVKKWALEWVMGRDGEE